MNLIQINRNLSRRQLALFGLMWLGFFAGIGFLAYRGGATMTATVLWTAALLVPAAGWIWPGFLRAVYLGMIYATFPIGFTVSYLMLIALYYLVLTPVGQAMRLVGYDPMKRRLEPEADTYWITREPPASIDRYFRQF